jgi:molecular chaperone DnaJ
LRQKRDYYEVLTVTREASEQEIKSAYRRLGLQHHPDRNPESKEESEERFKEITEAYSVLADPQKRAAYDRFGHAAVGGAGGGAPDFNSSIFSDFEDIFGDLFGFGDVFGRTGRGRSRSAGGIDLRYDLEITLEEAATGLDTKIKIPRWEACNTCGGSGAKPGSKPVSCPTCGGRGQLRHQQGFFTVTRTCPQCQGLGQVIREMCGHCKGEGRVTADRVLDLPIPAGVEDGQRLRITGEGGVATRGSGPGDLYVILKIREHAFFERRGNDLYYTIPISISQAALGAEITVPTLRGEYQLRIPESTQSGAAFRVRGLGMPTLEGRGHGDLYISVFVVTPTRLSRDHRRWLEILAPFVRVDNHPLERRAAEKVKDIFG